MPNESDPLLIVFFDGTCGLCNKVVDSLLQIDKQSRLLFAPLQSPVAQKLLPARLIDDLNTVAFFENGTIHVRSRAFQMIFRHLGFPWWFLSYLLSLVPSFVGEIVYRWVSRNRYGWFGQSESCRIPSESERNRILFDLSPALQERFSR